MIIGYEIILHEFCGTATKKSIQSHVSHWPSYYGEEHVLKSNFLSWTTESCRGLYLQLRAPVENCTNVTVGDQCELL